MEKTTDTKGTVSKTTFNKVRRPLVLLSSKLKTLQDNIESIIVYNKTILFFNISKTINLIILFMVLAF